MSDLFRLDPNPTFSFDVAIPPEAGKLRVTARHLKRKELTDFVERAQSRTDSQMLGEIVVGLLIAGPEGSRKFDQALLDQLLEAYPGAGRAIFFAYLAEIGGATRGNF